MTLTPTPNFVARSHECNYPPSIMHLPVVTSQTTTYTTPEEVDAQVSSSLSSGLPLYKIDEPLIKSLKPDIILTQDLCEVCAIDLPTVERLASTMSPRPQIVTLNPTTLEGVFDTISQVAEACGHSSKDSLDSLKSRVSLIDDLVASSSHTPPNIAFVEWPAPLYVGGHWTPELIIRAGGLHPLNSPGSKSFPVAPEALAASSPSIVVISPCGLPLSTALVESEKLMSQPWFSPDWRVAVVDGDHMFNRPGPRLVDAMEWLASVILERPDLCPDGFPVAWLRP